MKISFIIGIVTLYLVIVMMELMATGATTGSEFTSLVTSNSSAFVDPTYSTSSDWLSQAFTIFKNVGQYLTYWGGIFSLTSPTVFGGIFSYFWWFVCFPIDCGMIFAMFTIARGVHSG